MNISNIKRSSFFYSSLIQENRFQDFMAFKNWFNFQCNLHEFKVEQISLSNMDKWSFDSSKSRLSHDSGRFFSIEGIAVKTNFGNLNEWEQPIINQPEIGILGIITKIFDGVRYFLMQAKMEPGNINILQISPTLQATKSNFCCVHKGKKNTYLEYFNGEKQVKVLIDQLQTEQGGRFYKKRNRNMIIEVEEDIELSGEFCWLTLGELKTLLKEDNVLNMDTRSVLSTIPLIDEEAFIVADKYDELLFDSFFSIIGRDFIQSYMTERSLYSINDLISWYNQQKVYYELDIQQKSLNELSGWKIDDYSISCADRYFSVIGVKVSAGSREVTQWMQPLIKDDKIGLLAFVVKKNDGIIHFLVQAKVEPGNRDIIELSPTVSCSNYDYISMQQDRPFLFDEIFNPQNKIYYDSLQSEEGGRFYKIQNRNMIVEIDEKAQFDLPMNYIWMTLRQMNEFMRYGMFNIEARSIISGINFIN